MDKTTHTAESRPLPAGRRLGDLPAVLATLPHLGDDADAFAADLDEARAELGPAEARDPWECTSTPGS